ncbi:hypothetical protein [Bartonella grahamii]|nr:hypothetical protein [Bartonella grahamii]
MKWKFKDVGGFVDLCVVRTLGACWAFIMVWNGGEKIGVSE